jgi:hypothetical protein
VLAALAAALPGTAAAGPGGKFTVEGTVLRFDTERLPGGPGEIEGGDVDQLRKLLRVLPGLDTLVLHSTGGDYYAAFDMARTVADAGLDTEVDGECTSSCAIVFLGGAARRMRPGSAIGYHQTSWPAAGIEWYYETNRDSFGWTDPFQFTEWVYRDTQDEVRRHLLFLIERGVDPVFALETIRDQGDDIWYPDRATLRAGGVLRDGE